MLLARDAETKSPYADEQRLRKLDILEETAPVLGHDLNNVLQTVWANVSLARAYAGRQGAPPELAGALENAEHGMERMSGLVREFVAFARGQRCEDHSDPSR